MKFHLINYGFFPNLHAYSMYTKDSVTKTPIMTGNVHIPHTMHALSAIENH